MSRRIGIDLGGTKTEGILLSAEGATLRRERRPTPAAGEYGAILDGIVDLVRELEGGETCPVGVGTPGAISTRTGTLKNSNTLSLNGRDIHGDLEARLGRRIRVANDANCFALSEATDGAAAGRPVVFGVILGTGVGGGVVLDGRLHQGLQRIAGEWGHNVLDPGGPPCYCGRRGCVETFLSGPGLVRDYESGGGASGGDAAAILRGVDEGEASAVAAWQRYLERFGRALAGVINVLDPDAVVLGGGLSNVDRLYEEGREALEREVFNDELLTPLLRNAHGDSSGVRGAALLWERDDVAWEA